MHQEMDDAEQNEPEDEEMPNQLKEDEPVNEDDVDKKTSEMVNQSKKSRKKGEENGTEGAESKVEGISISISMLYCGVTLKCFAVEGEISLTATVKRGPEGNYVTQHELALAQDATVSMETIEQLRLSLQERLSTWSSQPVSL